MEWKRAINSAGSTIHHPVYTLVGTEITLVEQFIKAIRTGMEQETGMSAEVHRFYYDEMGCDEAVAECETVSLFSAESIVVLDNCTGITSQSKGKQDLSTLERYLGSPNNQRVFVIVSYAEKLDERKKAVKLLKSFPVIDCNTPKESQALELLQELAQQRKLAVDSEALSELWRRTQSVTIAEKELDKLQDYANGRVTVADVRQVTPISTEENVFQWIEGVLKGNLAASFEALQVLQQSGTDAFALFALLARQLRIMWYAKVFGNNPQNLARRLGVHPYALKMAGQQARGISAERIERLLCIIADSEFMVKSGRRDLNQALDWIVLSCATSHLL